MAATEQDVKQAYDARSAARSALAAAREEEAKWAADPTKFAELEAAKARSRAAQDAVRQADAEFARIQRAYDQGVRQRVGRPLTPVEEAKHQEALRNSEETGIYESSASRRNAERQAAPKPARTDSPVQQAQAQVAATNANTNIRRASEAERKNRATEQQNAIDAQIEALYKAGLLSKDVRGQVSQEAQTGYRGEIDIMEASVGAAKSLMENDTARRNRAVDIKKARASFLSTTLNTAMPQFIDLLLKSPKGSKVATQFLLAYLTMANDAYKNAGLEEEEPPVDMNSPWMQTLRRVGGYGATRPIPEMPTTQQIGWRTAVSLAGIGQPVDGWQGPIGVEANALPDMPPGTNGNGVNPLDEAHKSPEGKALRDRIMAPLQGIPTDPAQQTSEQRAQVAAAKAQYQAELKQLAQSRQAQRAPDTAQSAQNTLRQQLRADLISGDPNVRVRQMATIAAGLENQARGLPPTAEQRALLENLDPEDLKLIQPHLTPEFRALLTKPRDQRTEADYATVQNVLTQVTTGLKNRPLSPTAPPEQPQSLLAPPPNRQADSRLDPNVVQAAQVDEDARKREQEAITQERPELGAIFDQPEPPRLTGPSFLESTEWTGRQPEPEEPAIPEIPKLFGGFESIAEAPGYQPDLSELRPPMQFEEPEMPQLLAPMFEQDEDEEKRRRRSLFDPSPYSFGGY